MITHPPNQPIRLNIGSGQRPFGNPDAPWVNIDCQQRWNPDICDDGSNLCAHFKPATVDVIVLHHVLEHYGCGESAELLKACHTVLKPRGSLLIFVPDMWAISTLWRSGELSDQVYLTNVYGAYMGDEADRHKWGFTHPSLSELLMKSGFPKVYNFDWRDIPGANIAYDKWILGMEAIR